MVRVPASWAGSPGFDKCHSKSYFVYMLYYVSFPTELFPNPLKDVQVSVRLSRYTEGVPR